MTPEQMQAWRWEQELDERNRPLSDEELDALFPQDGYKVGAILISFHSYLFILTLDLDSTFKLSTYTHSCSQTDCHTHSYGYEWVSLSS